MVNFYSWVILEIFLFLFGDLQFSRGVLMSGFIFPEPAFYMVETLQVQNSRSSPLQIFIPCHPFHRRRQWHPTPVLSWKIPWMEEPGRLQSIGSRRVRHDQATSLSLFTFMHWRRKGQPTPVFLPGESQGRGSLVGCRLWGHTESDTTEAT